jgi:hypothetical protein
VGRRLFAFIDEAKLTDRVTGASGFAERFSSIGPRDKGRSLRELDLNRRLMKYPCSYLIHSPAFDALPARARTRSTAACGRCCQAKNRMRVAVRRSLWRIDGRSSDP